MKSRGESLGLSEKLSTVHMCCACPGGSGLSVCLYFVKAKTGDISVFCSIHMVRTARFPDDGHVESCTLVARNHTLRDSSKAWQRPSYLKTQDQFPAHCSEPEGFAMCASQRCPDAWRTEGL